MRKKALLNEEREILVINWFAQRIQVDNLEVATLSEIARGLGMSPSSHLRGILDNMVENQALDKSPVSRPGRWDGWGYSLKQGTYKRVPKQQRTLKINSAKGTQLELF